MISSQTYEEELTLKRITLMIKDLETLRKDTEYRIIQFKQMIKILNSTPAVKELVQVKDRCISPG